MTQNNLLKFICLFVLTSVFILGFSLSSSAQTWDVGGNTFSGGGTAGTPEVLGTLSDDGLSILAGGTQALFINSDGNITVGTSRTFSTDFLMSVDGNMRARSIRVNSDYWADYVFDSTYNLMPLAQLEEYVTTEGHLPDVPTEAEVCEDGIDLATMNAQLLKKVEELTLYMIEMNKRIKELEKQLQETQTGQ